MESPFNLPGRYAWCIAELVGPINMLFIIYTLPGRLYPTPAFSSSFAGTGLPFANELLAFLYVLHYSNRAVITPLFFAPSMSPIHAAIAIIMVLFQYTNSSCIACWLVYSTQDPAKPAAYWNIFALLSLVLFMTGLAGNILSEHALFDLRRGAAKRKAKSEGKAEITYDKVYVIPPAQGWFEYVLCPHYVLEWSEWTGYWLLAASFGFGYNTPALWFLINELVTMAPRAVTQRVWYEQKFGKRAVAGRGGVAPLSWL